MKPRVFIAHGFNSTDHSRWVEDLRSVLEAEGHPVTNVSYGWKHLLRIRRVTSRESFRLARVATTRSIGIGHSNGCALLLQAARHGARLEHLVFINPALPPHTGFPVSVRRVDAFYAPDDSAVVWGKRWAKYNPLRLLGWSSPWGTAGRVGFAFSRGTGHRNWNMGGVGHSGALRWDRIVTMGDVIRWCIENPDGPVPYPSPLFGED